MSLTAGWLACVVLWCSLISQSALFAFFFFNYYLFIWLHWVLVAAGGLLSCGMWAPQLWQAASSVLACELLVAACMWDLVPWPGIKPGLPALGARSLISCATREVPCTVCFWNHHLKNKVKNDHIKYQLTIILVNSLLQKASLKYLYSKSLEGRGWGEWWMIGE